MPPEYLLAQFVGSRRTLVALGHWSPLAILGTRVLLQSMGWLDYPACRRKSLHLITKENTPDNLKSSAGWKQRDTDATDSHAVIMDIMHSPQIVWNSLSPFTLLDQHHSLTVKALSHEPKPLLAYLYWFLWRYLAENLAPKHCRKRESWQDDKGSLLKLWGIWGIQRRETACCFG